MLITGVPGAIVKLADWFVVPKALEAVRVEVKLPAVVGTPLMSPLVAMDRPPGNPDPLKVIGSVPVAVRAALNATPTVPEKTFVGEKERVGATPAGAISRANASACPEGMSVWVPTETEAVPYDAPTVPHICPVPTALHPPPESVPAAAGRMPQIKNSDSQET